MFLSIKDSFSNIEFMFPLDYTQNIPNGVDFSFSYQQLEK